MASKPEHASQSDPVPRAVMPRRVPLGRSRKKLSFERRLRIWLCVFALPAVLLAWWYCAVSGYEWQLTCVFIVTTIALWSLVATYFFESIVRPLQTLSNIVAALREDDYSFRARGALRGDAMGDLALELNALAATMQRQRNSAMDALALADRVMRSMQSPVLAFDEDEKLRLMNVAAERAFNLQPGSALGRTARELNLEVLLQSKDESLYSPKEDSAELQDETAARWSVRRSSFRLHGVPHALFVLTDVAAALREEERQAWQRLIRVLGHEINNSLTPIKSIASTLLSRPLRLAPEHTTQDLDDIRRGLAVIENRSDSLNRFLQAYQQLSHLPPPRMRDVRIHTLVEQTIPLERRLRVQVESSPDTVLRADPDQLQQLLINLLKNAADAALDPDAQNLGAVVQLQWKKEAGMLVLQVTDNGPGLANPDNLFVPFYTTKPEGAGIGLTLSRQIAAAHQGSVTLRNRTDGQGCIAEVLLPLAPAL
jgi:two-component system nitrogen regulation sensor histidine kinase NtrY